MKKYVLAAVEQRVTHRQWSVVAVTAVAAR